MEPVTEAGEAEGDRRERGEQVTGQEGGGGG